MDSEKHSGQRQCYSIWNPQRLRIVQRDLGSRHVKSHHGREEPSYVAHGFLESPFVNHQRQSHHPSYEDRSHEQIRQNLPTYECPQSASQLPIARAQAAQKNKRQEQQQPQPCAQQGSLQSKPSASQRVHCDPDQESRHGEPVWNPAAAPIGITGDQRQRYRQPQGGRLQTSPILAQKPILHTSTGADFHIAWD